jgi:apolipoprotein N-acyltransferase
MLFPPWDLRWLAPLTLSPLLVAVAREPSWKRRAFLGLAGGFVYWLGVCHWIEWVLEHHGSMSSPLGWLAEILLCLIKGSIWAVFAALAGPLMRRAYAVPAVAALWTGLERLNGPQGFAWLILGNAGIDMSVPLRMAPVTGAYGLSFVFAMMGSAIASVILRQPRTHLAPLGLLPLLYLLPAIPESPAPEAQAVAVQPNVPQSQPLDLRRTAELMQRMAASSLESALDPSLPRAELLLWPESPAPFYFEADPVFRSEAQRLARAAGIHFLFGTVATSIAGQPLNSAQMLLPSGEPVSRYDKMFLVPFGEFVPPLFGWVNRITQEGGDFEPGASVVTAPVGRHRVGAFICYESAFPHLVRQFARQGGQVLINLTNDGYFGRSAARRQHLLLARMRAVENRRWLLRPTNDGYTVSIDPSGRIRQTIEPFRFGVGRLPFAWISEQTLYTRWGDWFAWSCLGLALGACVVGSRPSRTS